MTQPKLYHVRYLNLFERGIFLARKIKNPGGQRADKKISLSVTTEFQSNIKILADITNGGNVNDLIVGVMERVLKKNSATISKAARARKSYQTTIKKLSAAIDLDSPADIPVAQDLPPVEKSVGSDDE